MPGRCEPAGPAGSGEARGRVSGGLSVFSSGTWKDEQEAGPLEPGGRSPAFCAVLTFGDVDIL